VHNLPASWKTFLQDSFPPGTICEPCSTQQTMNERRSAPEGTDPSESLTCTTCELHTNLPAGQLPPGGPYICALLHSQQMSAGWRQKAPVPHECTTCAQHRRLGQQQSVHMHDMQARKPPGQGRKYVRSNVQSHLQHSLQHSYKQSRE
jgi:hypothetical protein